MSNFPTMTAEVTFPVPGQLARVDVTHAPAQSYSKAVRPRAMKAARQVLRGVWVMCTVDYHNECPATGRCTTTYYFVGARHGDNIEVAVMRGAAMVDGLVDDEDGPPTATSRVHV
jgi:hypothetical protein